MLEAAVVGHADADELIKPKAFVVLKDGHAASAALEAELKAFVKDKIAPYKYPRWIEFVAELPEDRDGQDPALQAAAVSGRAAFCLGGAPGGLPGIEVPRRPVPHPPGSLPFEFIGLSRAGSVSGPWVAPGARTQRTEREISCSRRRSSSS